MRKIAHAVLIVKLDVDPEVEEEFNRWYDTEHVPMFLKVPGVLSARRAVRSQAEITGFEIHREGPKYITIYEYSSAAVMNQKRYMDVLQTEWAKKLQPHIKNFSLTLYELLPKYHKNDPD
jgi:hypothetical protein